jgi:hypothetical protein
VSRARIFAYGSNMHPERMRTRVPDARALGAAALSDHRLALNKRGRDGSAKANLVRQRGDRVWGVVWELEATEVAVLDGYEGGYERVAVAVTAAAGPVWRGEAYVSHRVDEALLPFAWYLRFLVEGARAHGFPEDYVAFLESLPSRAS